VLDVNHDGRINNGSELVDLTGTAKPINLLSLDRNKGGILNAAEGSQHIPRDMFLSYDPAFTPFSSNRHISFF